MTHEPGDGSDRRVLNELFEPLYEIVPEGMKAEVVEGVVIMWPQRSTYWKIIRSVLRQLDSRRGPRSRLMSDVRLDLPRRLDAFCPDLFKLSDGAEPDGEGHWRHQDVEFVLEVISRETGSYDYGPKKAAYAEGDVPVYLIVDPYTAKWHLHTLPENGVYRSQLSMDFGAPVDLTGTALGLTLETGGFPRSCRR
ncbi:Uma2 family endonuclease [Streptomyces monomycini]|uniref:Uma2 family endonuclease n=1 Tax=Streptomyces monomycini TaxID=371720 RepID=UPI0004AA80D9|nr:Uma2 family endonuclease [Streptomyces monomycini]